MLDGKGGGKELPLSHQHASQSHFETERWIKTRGCKAGMRTTKKKGCHASVAASRAVRSVLVGPIIPARARNASILLEKSN